MENKAGSEGSLISLSHDEIKTKDSQVAYQ